MKRPVPVVLTAILLGLLAALQLLLAACMAFAALMAHGHALPSSPAGSPLPPSFLPAMLLVMSFFFAAIAVWLILTLIGLVRLRSWARYSVLVLGGLMAGFGAMCALSSIATPYMISSLPSQPGVDLAHMHVFFFIAAAFYAFFAALGVALLISFNLANTRAVFQQTAPIDLTPPRTSTGRPRPTAITVISWIYLISAPFCLIYLFVPYPAFLFGFIFYGVSAHLLYGAFGVLTFAIGYGLFRLRNQARLAVFWLFALCPLQAVVLLTPWGRRQFQACMDAMYAINAHTFATPQPQPGFAISPVALVFFSLIATAVYGIVLWFLHRHRDAFTPLPPAPPMPTAAEPLAG